MRTGLLTEQDREKFRQADHALAAGDALMLRDILLNHAWSLFNHSELSLLEESLKALPWDSLLEIRSWCYCRRG